MRVGNIKKVSAAALIGALPLIVSVQKGFPLFFVWNVVYGGADLSPDTNVISMLLFLCPIVFFAYAFSDFFCGEFHERLPYILTRSSCRVKWFLKKTLYLLGWALLFAVLHGVFLVIVGLIKGIPLDFSGFGKTQLLSFVGFFLHSFTLAWLTGIAALKFDSVKATIGLVLLHIGIFEAVFSYAGRGSPQLLRFLPVTQFLLCWHTLEWENALFSVPGLTISYSVLYLALFWAVILTVSAVVIRKLDVL